MLSNLVYVSQKTSECTSSEVDVILESCQKNNAHIDATGVLLHSNTHFLQYLEGNYSNINRLYSKIKEDKRHKNVVLLTAGPIKERVFPSWQMGYKQFSNTDISYNTKMDATEQRHFSDLISGKTQESQKVVRLIEKFFK